MSTSKTKDNPDQKNFQVIGQPGLETIQAEDLNQGVRQVSELVKPTGKVVEISGEQIQVKEVVHG